MKKTLTVIALLAGAVSGYSQGEVIFNLYNGSYLKLAVFNTSSLGASTYAATYGGKTVYEQIGNTSANTETPKGTSVYTGGGLSGTAYDIELLAGPANTPMSGLSPVSSVFNFKTGAATLGIMSGSQTVTLPSQDGTTASVAIAAWSSAYSSLANAVASGVSGTWGISPVEQTSALPVSPAPAGALPQSLESFSLGVSTPEPSTIALGVMGASALLFRRRK
jgi:hypothetical protein